MDFKPFDIIENKSADELYQEDLEKAENDGVLQIQSKPYFANKSSKVGVLLIHGFSASPKEIEPLTKELESRNITVYAVRVAGHGSSIDDMIQKSYMDWYDSISIGYNVLKKVCEKICIAGQSNGGLLASAVASSNKYDGLVLIAPAFKVIYPGLRLIPYLENIIKYIPRVLSKEDKLYNYKGFPLKSTHELIKLEEAVIPLTKDFDKPVLTAVSEKDVLISPAVAINIHKNMKSTHKTLLTYNNFENKVTHILTTNRSLNIVRDIADWIEENI